MAVKKITLWIKPLIRGLLFVLWQLTADGIPHGAKVALFDDREHVVTVELSSPSAPFSQSHKDIAEACAINGWLEVSNKGLAT